MHKNSNKFEFFVQITWHLLLEKNLDSFLGRVCWCQARYSRGVIPLENFLDQTGDTAGGRGGTQGGFLQPLFSPSRECDSLRGDNCIFTHTHFGVFRHEASHAIP